MGRGAPIARTGDQNTFVFFKDGVETFVIHPGFKGKVEQFGMLIPFPSIPELRKVSDNIFPHVRSAIDPPEIVVYAAQFGPGAGRFVRGQRKSSGGNSNGLALKMAKQAVRVVKEEAVGMYEVAVLEAGSAKALQKWMDDHGYKYPQGMDKACEDYVKIGWCFVAVKSKVSGKKRHRSQTGNAPREDRPTDRGFVRWPRAGDGLSVQDRSTRRADAAFDIQRRRYLHNIVYVLTDGPRKIRSVPEEYVVRQISGDELYNNLTQPLPLRVIGGTVKQIQPWQKKTLPKQRNPGSA